MLVSGLSHVCVRIITYLCEENCHMFVSGEMSYDCIRRTVT